MKTINKIILSLLTIVVFSCEDILEKDITDDIVQTISPAEGDVIETNTINFQWNSLKGATKYRLQVFNENKSIALDSLVNKTNLNFELPAGEYKWKVRGENFGYQSIYSELVSFSTEVSDDLTGQKVTLTIPEDNTFIKPSTLSLSWRAISVATSYDFKVITQSGTIILEGKDLPAGTTTVPLTIPITSPEGKYSWTVIAKNSGNSTQTDDASRSFSVDKTNPNPPTGLTPNNTTQAANSRITFTWVAATDSGIMPSPINYILEYSNSATFDTVIFTSSSLTNTTFNTTIANAGEYFWRVKAVDKAINESAWSAVSKITIN